MGEISGIVILVGGIVGATNFINVVIQLVAGEMKFSRVIGAAAIGDHEREFRDGCVYCAVGTGVELLLIISSVVFGHSNVVLSEDAMGVVLTANCIALVVWVWSVVKLWHFAKGVKRVTMLPLLVITAPLSICGIVITLVLIHADF